MNHKPLGQTRVLLPEIGFGTWQYTAGPEPLRQALEAGARFLDTAETYGSEPVVAEAIHGQRDRVFLATKVSRAHLRHDDVLRAADQSLRALGTDYLDLYQIHFPNDEVPLEETCAALEELVDAGKVRFIGVSNFSVTQLQRAQKAMRKHPIVSNQVRYHLADRVIECGLLSYCQASHVTVIAYSPLGHQLQRIRDRDPGRVLDEIAQAAGKTAPQVMLNWCLCREGVVVIPKASSIDHVLEDCGASGWRLTAGQCARLNATFSFRCKSRAEVALRRLVSPLGPFVKPCFKKLPPPLRRWVE